MRFSLAYCISFLIYSVSSSLDIAVQVALNDASDGPSYGYAGPGVYRIVSYTSNLAVSLNTTETPTGLVTMPLADKDNAQRWYIAEISPTEKLIINNGTGALLSSIPDNRFTRAIMAPPYDLKAHWTFDFDIYKDYTGSPVMLKNLGRKNTALDLSGSKKPAGSPVLAYPINNQTNQAWLLEYLETVTPAPPPPGPCEFPERDQKAMRGSIVEECVTFTWFTSAFPNAEECYNWMNSFPKEYGILSYVFFAATIPGSPDSGSTWSECRGYYGRSYLYFVGNATGPGFGGDLALPFK